MEQNKVSISAGIVWNSRIEDMEETLKEADRCMYVEKDKYHKMTGGVVVNEEDIQEVEKGVVL